ncbi:MAG TPA: DUF2948 family protein [Beijerinckiaceae bacterium]
MEPLKLIALDPEDLAVVSAHLQDAVLRVKDLAFLPREHRFALVARRFDWEASTREAPRRRLTGLHFERVTGARLRGLDRSSAEATLNLLAITFEERDAPSGVATLHFSEGAAIQLDLECLEVAMKDLGPVWQADSRPQHVVELEAR